MEEGTAIGGDTASFRKKPSCSCRYFCCVSSCRCFDDDTSSPRLELLSCQRAFSNEALSHLQSSSARVRNDERRVVSVASTF
uniref:Uncharacterized protein n=1 Tax=Hyaloperonospora arabidopsidis (strain Emoy2) TaxID=559515 RepID=M4BG00_HYAAE